MSIDNDLMFQKTWDLIETLEERIRNSVWKSNIIGHEIEAAVFVAEEMQAKKAEYYDLTKGLDDDKHERLLLLERVRNPK